MGNLNVVMINVTSRDDGLRVLDRVDAATETGEINVEDVAMVYKTDKGKVKIQQTADATAGKGAVKGGQGRWARSARRDHCSTARSSGGGGRGNWGAGGEGTRPGDLRRPDQTSG
jgi:hypothetical protein